MNWFKRENNTQNTQVNATLKALNSNGVTLTIDELIRYQSKSALIDLSASKSLHGKMSGNYLARSKGNGMEFDEVRHYQNGDDIRAIDWRVTARTGKTHTKLFREEIERPVLIATDMGDNMLFGSQLLFKSVQAAHLAALVAWHAKKRGDRIGGMIFNHIEHSELKPRSRQQGVLHYLHTLVKSHQQSLVASQTLSSETSHFADNCARLRQLAKPGSMVYLITDAFHLTDNAVRHLSHISRHCELVVCLITDPLEHALPHSQEKMTVAISNGQQKQQFLLGDKKLAKQYQQQANMLQQIKQQTLTKAGARILHFSASESIEAQLQRGVTSWIR